MSFCRLRARLKGVWADPQHSFPDHGQPEASEIARLKREAAKLKPERYVRDTLVGDCEFFALWRVKSANSPSISRKSSAAALL
jgi:hypothetical protein